MGKMEDITERRRRLDSMMEKLDRKVVEIEISDEMIADLKEVAGAHWWDFNDSLRKALGAGIGALMAEKVVGGDKNEGRIGSLSRQLAESHRKLSAAHYELSEMRHANKQWELTNNALREAITIFKETIRRQSTELDRLGGQSHGFESGGD